MVTPLVERPLAIATSHWASLAAFAFLVHSLRVRPEKIEEMDRELTKVIEDFGHAVNVETLYFAKKTGKHLISQPDYISFSVFSRRATTFVRAAEACRNRP